jgi:hypothetical protein
MTAMRVSGPMLTAIMSFATFAAGSSKAETSP